jgi:hypothetical protein
MSNFAVYMIGIIIVAGALAYGAYALSVPPVWIGVGAAIIIGFGLMGAAKKPRNDSYRR